MREARPWPCARGAHDVREERPVPRGAHDDGEETCGEKKRVARSNVWWSGGARTAEEGERGGRGSRQGRPLTDVTDVTTKGAHLQQVEQAEIDESSLRLRFGLAAHERPEHVEQVRL